MARNPLELSDVALCHACPTLGDDHVPSVGRANCKLMIVGQSPGAKEVEERQPFVGPCGEMLDYMLDEACLTRDDVYIANALKCRPPGNRPGLESELVTCFKTWLRYEIKVVEAPLVLLLGRDAALTVLPGSSEFKHGLIYQGKTKKFLVSYHPAYFLRRGEEEAFVKVGETIRKILEGSHGQTEAGSS